MREWLITRILETSIEAASYPEALEEARSMPNNELEVRDTYVEIVS